MERMLKRIMALASLVGILIIDEIILTFVQFLLWLPVWETPNREEMRAEAERLEMAMDTVMAVLEYMMNN